ncbi:MAG: hypothetical protein A2Y62_10040 [Candidatus Fischerbacteria bacterium RBG_13_37_8]|uniref:DUF4382 domain-containing protein n=1 Tax=Candidatus Fischerbacteria bacterium RBG_13_37_8 TaxID=1817863 RepID=A0A1F5V5X1_9BACT|nr:MAG: hypothetical protein A2Y62_10040 [Candidatus Fischerbacteria bacterium RBG_13_37_8]
MRKINIIFLSLLLLILFFVYCSKSPTLVENPAPNIDQQSPQSPSKSATIRILLKDSPIDEAEHIYVTINRIRVHKASPENFIVISEEEQVFDLLELKNNPRPLIEASLTAGHYNQIRMDVISGTIVIGGAEFQMKIPSSEIKIPVQFTLEQDMTAKLTLDFDAEKSIKVNKQGKKDNYTLRPVIKVVGLIIT